MPSTNEQQFMEWYDAYADAIFRYCYFRIHDYEKAKDLVQEVFTRTWEYMERGSTIDNGKAFLYRVATNSIINAARKKEALSLDALKEEQGFDPGTGHPERALWTHLDAKRIIRIMDELEENQKELIVLRFINGLGPKDIAAMQGVSENVVSVRLHRALEKLRSIIHTYDHPEEIHS